MVECRAANKSTEEQSSLMPCRELRPLRSLRPLTGAGLYLFIMPPQELSKRDSIYAGPYRNAGI
jgi:hypothetical protein